MVDKNKGFYLYNKDGSVLREVQDESEMQTIFSKVLKKFDEEQRKRYGDGEPLLEETNNGTHNASLERAAAASRISPENPNHSAAANDTAAAAESSSSRNGGGDGRRKKRQSIQASSTTESSNPDPSSTRRSRRQSSRRSGGGGVPGASADEGLMSLTYSYGSMDWDAIEMCWKPKKPMRGTGKKRKRPSNSSFAKPAPPTKKPHMDPSSNGGGENEKKK
mmetsp:Transcript_78/g.132  ORF Transcript_78/g.132 Transcript_78/m.132 type:complete len:220 (-) Transcript_78:70-729(-)